MARRGFILILYVFIVYSCIPLDLTDDPNSEYYVNPNELYPIPDSYKQVDSISNIYVEYDPFDDDYTYNHKYLLTTGVLSPLKIHFEQKVYGLIIKINFTYRGDDWIFFNSATIINESGGRVGFGFEEEYKFHDVNYYGVTEKATFFQDDDDHGEKIISGHVFKDQVDEMRKLLSKEEVIKMKLSGTGSMVYEFSNECRLALLETINYYYKLAGFNDTKYTNVNEN